jgi:hypothetical protein
MLVSQVGNLLHNVTSITHRLYVSFRREKGTKSGYLQVYTNTFITDEKFVLKLCYILKQVKK